LSNYFLSKEAVLLPLMELVIQQAETGFHERWKPCPPTRDVYCARASARSSTRPAHVAWSRAQAPKRWPPAFSVRDLATSLNLMNERTMTATLVAEEGAVASEQIVDALACIWLTSSYDESR
jgi:hypothetical protein